MLKIILALSLLAGEAWGAYADGTVALYLTDGNELVDVTGNFANITENAPVGSTSSIAPCSGTTSYGPFTPTAYYILPAALVTALQGYSAYYIEMCVWQNDRSNSGCTIGNGTDFIQMNTTGAWRWSINGNIMGPGANTRSLSQSAKIAISWDGTNRRMYDNDTLYLGPTANNGAWTAGTWKVGQDFGLEIRGYITSFRVMNTAAVPPIVDPSSATGNRGIKIQNSLRLKLSYLFDLFSTPAWAIEQDGPRASLINQENFLQANNTRTRNTPAPTRVRTPGTPTISPTVTPFYSATPSPVVTPTATPTQRTR